MVLPRSIPNTPPTRSFSSTPGTLIFVICLVAGSLLSSLTYEERDGGLVPTVIFLGRPIAFRIFVLALLLSFAASSGAIMHRFVSPAYGRLCRRVAAASLAIASAALAWASVWWGLALFGALAVAMHGGL
ncbi:hypothetical protein AXF42_Ash014937 [Apostasia shenzhenica]|uniref:Uncharacterized protein n=1 Tax=Apostasia shenzhenica TaxID=1088818 RepID=A0A2I0ALL1_9ASPA|nr:hypothetical protein AXF42_Ash014937 [Apostasia shenzhenica]